LFSLVAELVYFGKLGASRAGLASGKPGLLVASRRARPKCLWQVRAGRSLPLPNDFRFVSAGAFPVSRGKAALCSGSSAAVSHLRAAQVSNGVYRAVGKFSGLVTRPTCFWQVWGAAPSSQQAVLGRWHSVRSARGSCRAPPWNWSSSSSGKFKAALVGLHR